MKTSAHFTAAFLMLVASNSAAAQTSACANPQTPRVGIIILSPAPTASDSKSYSALLARTIDAERRFGAEIKKLLPANTCIVDSLDIFSDPNNYPQLAGTLLFEISAAPSFEKRTLYAFSVTVLANQGAYVEENVFLLTHSMLTEGDGDYAVNAKNVVGLSDSAVAYLKKNSRPESKCRLPYVSP